MGCNFYVKVEKNENHVGVNNIGVNIDYMKSRKQVYLSLYLAEMRPDGTIILSITSGETHVLEPMPRLNRKRVNGLRQEVGRQIAAKHGVDWNKIVNFAAGKGLTLL